MAAALGYVDTDQQQGRDVLLRRVNEAARAIAHALDLAWRRIDAAHGNRPTRGAGCAAPAARFPSGSAWPRTSWRRTARSCSPATPTRGPIRVWCCGSHGRRPSTTCRIAPFALERLAAESAPLPTPWPTRRSRRLPRRPGRRGSRRSRCSSRSTTPGCSSGSFRSGTRCAAAPSTTRCTASPSTGTCWRPRPRAAEVDGNLDRRDLLRHRLPAARHRQGVPDSPHGRLASSPRGPLDHRRRARRGDRRGGWGSRRRTSR